MVFLKKEHKISSSLCKNTSFFMRSGNIGSLFFSFFGLIFLFLFSIFLFNLVILNNSFIVVSFFDWFFLDMFKIEFGFFFDDLNVLFFIVITIISFFVFSFSFWYLNGDPFFSIFLIFFFMFISSMLLLITSYNLFFMYLGWEGVGLCSFLLISFWNKRKTAVKSALLAILLNKIGDFFFFFFFCCICYCSNTLEITSFLWLSEITFSFGMEDILCICCLCLFFSAVIKSSQIGFHIWLPEAMEGPTPVSALIHAATMVTAGIYLLLRFWYLFELFPFFTLVISFIGSLTCFFGTIWCLVVNDIKKIVAFSTCGQLGYLFVGCAFLNNSFALFHLCTHAFFKALLFIVSGSIIYGCSNEQDIRKYGGFGLVLPFHLIVFICCSFNLIGIPYFSGFFSKENILFSFFNLIVPFYLNSEISFFSVSCVLWLSSVFFSFLYSIKLIWYSFFGFFRGKENSNIVSVIPRIQLWFFFFLLVFSSIIGVVFTPFFELYV